MTEILGQVSRSRSEEIWVSLEEIRGESYLELRVYRRVTPGDVHPVPGKEGIPIPVGVLPDLLGVLLRAQEVLVKRGVISGPSSAMATVLEDGEAKVLPLAGPSGHQPTRRSSRVPLSLTAECHFVPSGGALPDKPVTGEARDLSMGGAQVWLPKRFPRFAQVDVSMTMAGRPFQARAEVVGVAQESNRDPTTGYYRHSLQWVLLDAQAKAALSQVVPMR